MAKLNVNIDTETQKASVTVDGVEVPNVKYVCISNWSYDGNPSFHFSVDSSEVVGDVTKTTCLYANKKDTCVASVKYPGLFEETGEVSKATSPFSIAKLAENARKSREA